MWNDTVTLVSVNAEDIDEDGFPVKTETLTPGIAVNFKSVGQTEFYRANSQDIKADLIIELMAGSYDDQTVFIDERTNKRYAKVRSFITHSGERVEVTVTDISEQR